MTTQNDQIYPELIQGTAEWLKLRKTKITATDAAVILGVSHWKTPLQLYKEKTSNDLSFYANKAMQRGIDLESVARALFTIQTGIEVEPKVVIKDWAMASLDGISEYGNYLVEIKCPGEKDHAVALSGKVPNHYYPQLQHQMWVCDVEKMIYFSFDGTDGVAVEVVRDSFYVEKMIDEEFKFYQCLINRISPEPVESDYTERDDPLWVECSSKWKTVSDTLKRLEKEEEELRNQLIFLSEGRNSRGSGISLCQVQRKGNIDYSKIPELKNVDLDKYRKSSTNSWRINSN